MGPRKYLVRFSLLALWLAAALPAQESQSLGQRRRELPARKGPNAIAGHDRPDLRRDWNLYWFGGRPSVEYLDFKAQAAVGQARVWNHLMPRPEGLRPSGKQMFAGPTWVNRGPFGNLTTTDYPDHDAGRLSAVLADPRSDRKVLYAATSGGGVFKCTNADHALPANDWVWTPITDALPASSASGNVSIGALTLDPSNPDTLFLGLGDHVLSLIHI